MNWFKKRKASLKIEELRFIDKESLLNEFRKVRGRWKIKDDFILVNLKQKKIDNIENWTKDLEDQGLIIEDYLKNNLIYFPKFSSKIVLIRGTFWKQNRSTEELINFSKLNNLKLLSLEEIVSLASIVSVGDLDAIGVARIAIPHIPKISTETEENFLPWMIFLLKNDDNKKILHAHYSHPRESWWSRGKGEVFAFKINLD